MCIGRFEILKYSIATESVAYYWYHCTELELNDINDGMVTEYWYCIKISQSPIIVTEYLLLIVLWFFFESSQWNSDPNYSTLYLDLVVFNIKCKIHKAHDLLLHEDRNHPALDITLQLKICKISNDVVNYFPIYNYSVH